MEKFVEPWEYYVFDDFFHDRDLALIKDILYFFPKCTTEGERCRVPIGSAFSYEDDPAEHNFPELRQFLSNKVKNVLSTYDEFADLHKKKVFIEYQSLGKNFEWEVHKDTPSKYFSLVLYLEPVHGSCGTRIYDGKEFVREVEWKQNRAVAFYNEAHHLHDFYSNVDKRITLNFVFLQNGINP